MSNIRIIPRLDVKGPNVVKGIHTEGLRVIGSPAELAQKYYENGADEIIYMDIVASLYQRTIDLELLKATAKNIYIPITAGGGIRSINDISNVLRAGADKVAINTFAINEPEFLSEAVKKFGSQCIALSVEAKKIGALKWEAYTDCGREKTGLDAIEWIKKGLALGVGEILLTSIDKDGLASGFEIELIKEVASFARIPVIAHGGAKDPASVTDALRNGNADAIAISSALHYGWTSIKELKKYLNTNNFEVRII